MTLPIGTIIIFHIYGDTISPITIKPSVLDIEQTEGLCGYISKTRDRTDDFMPRGSNTTTSANEFVRSWRYILNYIIVVDLIFEGFKWCGIESYRGKYKNIEYDITPFT